MSEDAVAPKVPSRARMLLRKAWQNARWDLAFVRGAPLDVEERVRYVVAKYRAILSNSRTIRYLGAPFHYDNRWTPALLQPYVSELRQLDALIDLGRARTILDVGANVGQFAATALALFPHLRVWSLEPNISIFGLLELNSERHPHWHALPFGLADEDQVRKLWFVPEKSAQGSVYRDNARVGLLRGELTCTEVELRRLTPELCHEHGMPTAFDVVKVDVEGFERKVLRGLRDIRWKHLAFEASVARVGRVDDPEALIDQLWGNSCRLVYASAANETSTTRQFVFSC